MKKVAAKKLVASARGKPGDLASLIAEVRTLIQSARRGVASVVDTFQVMTNFEIAGASWSMNRGARGGRRTGRSC